jgi:hypothetical protein
VGRIHLVVGYWLGARIVPGQRRLFLLEEELEEAQTLNRLLEELRLGIWWS